MKKFVVLLLAVLSLFTLVCCGANKHTCRAVDGEEIVDLQLSSLSEPFIEDDERDELLSQAIRSYLDELDKQSMSFTYEIMGTNFGVYENKETILYWVKIVYGEGFTTVLGFIIQ